MRALITISKILFPAVCSCFGGSGRLAAEVINYVKLPATIFASEMRDDLTGVGKDEKTRWTLREFLQLPGWLVLLLVLSLPCKASTVLVAVASNFSQPMTEIAEAFNKTTGHEANLTFGSSGKFVAQIENGAPFEVFLSADVKNPQKLEKSGNGVAKSRFTYAVGKLVLWSASASLVDDKGEILHKGGFKHLALSDPKLAPYGEAAEEVLKNLGVYDKLKSLIVLGENISQTRQFIRTGNAELGFIALSQAIGKDGKINEGSGWLVSDQLYKPIKQDAILLKKGIPNPAATALLEFLKSDGALKIIRNYGYELPK